MDTPSSAKQEDGLTNDAKHLNIWGAIGIILAVLGCTASVLSMTTLTVTEFVLEHGLYFIAIVPKLILFAIYAPLLFAVIGFFAARKRERVSPLVCLVVAVLGICWVQWTIMQHQHRAERAKFIAARFEAYAKEHGTYPKALSEVTDLTETDRAIVVLVSGVRPGEEVTFTPSLGGHPMPSSLFKARASRVVFYLKDVLDGDRVVYQSNGKLATVSHVVDFDSIINASK